MLPGTRRAQSQIPDGSPSGLQTRIPGKGVPMDLCSRLPARPLQRAVDLRRRSLGMSLEEMGLYLGVTGRTLHRLMGSRWIGVYAADHMAVRLGLHPSLLWPKEWTALTLQKNRGRREEPSDGREAHANEADLRTALPA